MVPDKRLILAGLMILPTLIALSQPAQVPTLHVSTDLIQVPVLALRPSFRAASGLDSSSFLIRLDGGPPFHPSFARVEGSEPIQLSIMADAERQDAEHLSKSLEAAFRGWPAGLLHGTDRLSLYAAGCRLARSLNQAPADLDASREAIARAASFTVFQKALEGGRPCPQPMDALLETVMEQGAQGPAWRVVILILDGSRTLNLDALPRLERTAAALGVTLFAIKYVHEGSFPKSAYADTEGINVLTSSLGGISLVSSFDDLGGVMQRIIQAIRQRYILSFQRPSNGSAGSHQLAVTTNRKGVRVRSSAASAPLPENIDASLPDSGRRPRYGTARPPE